MDTFLENGPKNPIKIQDNTFRDGHQSLLATRMRTEDMLPIAEKMDEVGYWAMEVWGGATFDTMHRFLGEDPFDRLRTLKKYIKKTPFSMLLRGQNLVGYRNYADDVARLFVDKSCEAGMDVFRVFDALNDFRNFETVVERIKENGKHFQGTICYSLTERRMGGEVFNIDYYLKKAKELQDMGANTLCLKDMAGIMAPFDIAKLVTELKKIITIPIHLHTHYTSGMASMVYLEAIKAGIDIIDTCLAPFALRTSQPAVEPIVATLYGTTRDPGFDLNKLLELGDYIEEVAPKYRDYLAKNRMSVIDTGVLKHQVPGGMISNLVSQLKTANALDRLPEVYKEVAAARKELGMPPLVTPTSQIVGTQAVLNVLQGRWKIMNYESMDLAMGYYGKTPIPVNPEIVEIATKRNKNRRPDGLIEDRVANHLEPELEKAKEKIGDLAKNDFDLIIYALYPTTGEQYLKWKYGLEERPDAVKPKTLDDIRAEDEAMAAAIEQICRVSLK